MTSKEIYPGAELDEKDGYIHDTVPAQRSQPSNVQDRCSVASTGPIACSELAGHAGPHIWVQRKKLEALSSKMPMIADLRKASQYGGIDLAFAKESLYWKAADEIERLSQSQWSGIEGLAKQRNEALEEVERLRTAFNANRQALHQVTAAYDKLLKRMGAVRAAIGTDPHFEPDARATEVERLRAALEKCDMHQRACETHDYRQIIDESDRLRVALTGLNDFYKNIWDRVDGGIMLFAEHVPAFEKAQAAADAALSGETGVKPE